MNAAGHGGGEADSEAGIGFARGGEDRAADTPAPAPAVQIDSAHVTPEEAAAVVAALTLLGGAAPPADPGPGRSLWNSRARAARPRLSPGPGAWRGSALPR